MYYCSIPQPVLLDENLSTSAKMLYGMIYILANSRYGCIAENDYFAKPLKVTTRQVRYLLADLKAQGYIEVGEVERPNHKQNGRIITLTDKSFVPKEQAKEQVAQAQAKYQKGVLPHDIQSDWFDDYMAKIDR